MYEFFQEWLDVLEYRLESFLSIQLEDEKKARELYYEGRTIEEAMELFAVDS